MPSLKDIRKRISSVKSTQKMARAMKMVSAAKLRRAQDAALGLKPYAERVEQMLQHLLESLEFMRQAKGLSIDHPFLSKEDVRHQKAAVLVVTSDRGMCGGFNHNLLRYAEEQLSNLRSEGREAEILSLGVHARTFFQRKSLPLFEDLGLFAECDWHDLAVKLRDLFMAGRFDAVFICYNRFVNAMNQKPTLMRLLPLGESCNHQASTDAVQAENPDLQPTTEDHALAIHRPLAELDRLSEPSLPCMVKAFLPRVFELRVHQALMESAAGEHAARMNAMGAATDNAAKMIGQLTLQLNRARQAAITTELVEIISGAEALK